VFGVLFGLSQRCALVLSPALVESLSLFTASKPMLLQYPPLTAFNVRAQPLRMPLSEPRGRPRTAAAPVQRYATPVVGEDFYTVEEAAA
jgi:hypothetical protein